MPTALVIDEALGPQKTLAAAVLQLALSDSHSIYPSVAADARQFLLDPSPDGPLEMWLHFAGLNPVQRAGFRERARGRCRCGRGCVRKPLRHTTVL
jgi:hypothetical protein